jgi:phage shock protein A
MSIFSRMKEMMENKMDALLDKTDDLEKMIEQKLRDMNKELGKIKADMASYGAKGQRLKRELMECHEDIEKLERYSLKAQTEGNEANVRMFLEKKSAVEAKLVELQTDYQLTLEKSEQMKPKHDQLMADISELESIKRSSF